MDIQVYRVLLARLCVSWIRYYLTFQCFESGDSFWKDHEGRGFTTDIGYAYEFLDAFADYLTRILEEKANEKLS